ncbi:Separin [Psilocybe cubensis]|uniref:Separin n=1 Tax=Psilocybe cubensis TaxID=181762 RepID=A0ACB8GSN3_PSICU|nr:Separin [Psilocybe cubensis]KAH9478241.1 Separin [Psilocybe cubensis]
MASATRRTTTREPSKLARSATVTATQLANELATKLTISNGTETKTTTKAKKTPENVDHKVLAMRSVNEASQALSGVVQSGWKKSADSSKTTLATATSAASKASKALDTLRKLRPGDLDVERAASSVLGKLIALEMFDFAEKALTETQPRLILLLNVDSDQSNPISIPPPSSPPTNAILLNLVSLYLLYALIIKSHGSNSVDELSKSLSSPTTHSLLSWLPMLSALPAKHTDSLLTRAYTAVNKLCSTSSSLPPTKSKAHPSPQSIFILRMYALRCLAHTTPGTIEANTFWDQATRYASVFVKATPQKGEEQTTSMILHAFGQLVDLAEQRTDREAFMSVEQQEKGFLRLCEHWLSFAKRAGDISAIQRINACMKQPSSSTPPKSQSHESATVEQDIVVDGTKVCTLFSQTLVLLENAESSSNNDLLRSIEDCATLLNTSSSIRTLLQSSLRIGEKLSKEQQSISRISGKVDRAFEKLRRMAIKYLDIHPTSTQSETFHTTRDAVLRNFLLAAVDTLHSVLQIPDLTATETRDLLTRSIDTLFVMSKTVLNVGEPSTFTIAFELLNRASDILKTVPQDKFPLSPVDQAVDIANYARCISGAFYNIAGSLYQASRYGNAVPFLMESCVLGAKALQLSRPIPEVSNEMREKEWQNLEEQFFRRWELLGVCYSKNGDRKNAYHAFKQSIHTFPFHSSGLTGQTDHQAPDILFGSSASSAIQSLVTLVDRISYIGSCDLLLPPEEISVLSATNFTTCDHPDQGTNPAGLESCVIGVLLERQLDSLEPSRCKDGVRSVQLRLLRDALLVYSKHHENSSAFMPVRRARILVRCLEFLYRDQADDACANLGFKTVDEIGAEIEELLTNNARNLGKDARLNHYTNQYRIASHLWVALHAHRRVDPQQTGIMSRHTDDACRMMKELLAKEAEGTPKLRKTSSPKIVKATVSPKVNKLVSPKQLRSTRQRTVPAAPRKAPPLRASQKVPLNPVTPKPRTRTALPATFTVKQTPPRRSMDPAQPTKAHTLIFDNFENFMSLLQLTARILGLLSLILPKARLLDMTRKLAQRHVGAKSDEFVISSLDLAHEYVLLGKTKRAASIFYPALEIVRSGQVSDDVAVRFLLRFSESLCVIGDVPESSKVYLEAHVISNALDLEQKGVSTQQRIYARAKVLEIAALASRVFSLVQFEKGDIYASHEGLLQSLRLWNRAVDAITRLYPVRGPPESDPFEMTSLNDALPSTSSTSVPTPANGSTTKKPNERRPLLDGLEWRMSEGLLSTMLALAQTYFLRGSAREAEYFAKQAVDLAEQMNAPGMIGRALTRQGEVQLHMGHLQDAWETLMKASLIVKDVPGLETVEIRRLKVECDLRVNGEDAVVAEDHQTEFNETVAMLEDLDAAFRQFDNLAFGPRTSLGSKTRIDVLAPDLLVSLLSQQLWNLRDAGDDNFNSLLEKLLSLSYSPQNKAEENALLGKLTLHKVYGRFRSDMFLSSLTESTIAVPMGMESKESSPSPAQSADMVDALSSAEKFFWDHLSLTASKGSVIKVREAAISLALISAFRTSLGDKKIQGSSTMASLLDISVALTLRRDMLDAIANKFPSLQCPDDLQWPPLSPDGAALPRPVKSLSSKFSLSSLSDSESDSEDSSRFSTKAVKSYWKTTLARYQSQVLGSFIPSTNETTGLPQTWAVINISVTPDKSTLFISRQDGGLDATEPLIFCIPLKGRRDHGGGDEDDTYLTFDAAIQEMKDIVQSSDDCIKSAVDIKSDDDEAKSNWWKIRGELDVRMRELLENIEYCWLGAFKSILSPRTPISPETTSELRNQFEKAFYRSLHVKEKKPKSKTAHRKTASQTPNISATDFTLDDTMINCFSTLSPKCRDEELEDLIYFVLDLYQFHGVPVAIAEVDIDQLVVDLRTVLEDHSSKKNRQNKPGRSPEDEHLFLVLDKNVQGLPWENIPILRGRSVSRIPGVQFLYDRLAFAKMKREANGQSYEADNGACIDPKNGYYVLNPSGDLGRTEERFRDWAKDMKFSGWDGVAGKPVSEQQFVNALKTRDIVVYFGHGGGEQYIRSHKIRSLPTCAATMLWGCSSGLLRDMGDFDRTGTPYNYMLAGCPTLIANLWDVTDKDIDKLSQSVFDKMGLTGKDLNLPREKNAKSRPSIVAAVAQSRDSCKLKHSSCSTFITIYVLETHSQRGLALIFADGGYVADQNCTDSEDI